jgi:TolA-binding protein
MFRKIALCVICCCIIPSANYVFADTTADIEQAKTAIKSYIAAGKDANAAYQKLITDFAGNTSVSAAAYDIAEAYRDNSKFNQSLGVYKDVVSKWPKSRQAVFAQKGVVVSNIALGKMADAQVELDNLKKNYSADPNISEAVFNVADTYYWFGKFSDSDGVYKYVSANYPKSDFAMWAQMGLAISSIAQDKDSDAQTIKDSLVANFATNPKLPEALLYIAGRYESSKKYDKAGVIFQQIAKQFPKSSQAMSDVPFAVARVNILSGIESGSADVPANIENMIANFSGRADLQWTLSMTIADNLYQKAFIMKADSDGRKKAYLQKSVDIWEMVTKTTPSLTCTDEGYSWAGDCYDMLGRYEEAVQCFQNVVDNYPNFKYTWHAQFMVGSIIQKLKGTGVIQKTEADKMTEAAYLQVLEKYPNCPVAQYAQAWINSNTK